MTTEQQTPSETSPDVQDSALSPSSTTSEHQTEAKSNEDPSAQLPFAPPVDGLWGVLWEGKALYFREQNLSDKTRVRTHIAKQLAEIDISASSLMKVDPGLYAALSARAFCDILLHNPTGNVENPVEKMEDVNELEDLGLLCLSILSAHEETKKKLSMNGQ